MAYLPLEIAIETEINITALEKSYKFNLSLIENDFHFIGLFK